MRSIAVVVFVPWIACASPPGQPAGTPDAPGDGGDSLPPPTRGFQIVSPTIDIDPGKDITYCYYFHTPNPGDMAIQRWSSHMTPGAHDLMVYLTPGDLQTPGTVSTTQCGINNSSAAGPIWVYAAQTEDAEARLPADDGTGTPVAQPVPAGHPGFLQMHYVNTTGATLHVHVELNAYAYDDGLPVTLAGPYVTYAPRIDLLPATPSGPTPGMVSGTCNVKYAASEPTPKFFAMTTYTHKQSVHTFVKDGDATLFNSTSWEQPGTARWDAPAFYSFASGQLGYQCEYMNPNSYEIKTGNNPATDEMCMAIGLFFPSPDGKGHFCVRDTVVY